MTVLVIAFGIAIVGNSIAILMLCRLMYLQQKEKEKSWRSGS